MPDLMGKGLIQNSKEIVFIPTGGVRGMGPVTKIVSSRDDNLPYVLLDSDNRGDEYVKQLKRDRYREDQNKVLQVNDFLKKEGEYEIEDLMPISSIVSLIDRKYRADNFFDDRVKEDQPIVNQIEN